MYYNYVRSALISHLKTLNNIKNNNEMAALNYRVLYSYYEEIKNFSSDEDVQRFLNNLNNDIKKRLANYDHHYAILQEMRKNNTPISERNKIAIIINNYAIEVNSINSIIELTNKAIAEVKFMPTSKKVQEQKQEVKPAEKKQEVKPAVKKQQAKSGEIVAEGFNREFLTNQYTLDYFLYSKTIKEKYQKIATMKYGSEEEKKLRLEIYDAVMGRRKLIIDLLSSDSSFTDIYNNLLRVESQEKLLYERNINPTMEEEDLDYNDCYIRISECLTEISDLNFAEEKDAKKLIEATDRFNNIIKSINDVIKSSKLKELARDLLNLASAYNLDGNYRKFEKRYRNKRLGTERVSKEIYRDGTSEISSKLGALFSELKTKLEDKKVHIKSHDKTFKEKERDLYKYHYDICNHLVTLKKGKKL